MSADDPKVRDAKARVVAALARGTTLADAAATVGRTTETVDNWRSNDRVFRNATLRWLRPPPEPLPFTAHRKRYFGHDTPAHHKKMVASLQGAKPGTLAMILAFPRAAKTTLLVDWICWKLTYDPNYRVAVISEGQDLARKIVGQIARRMTDVQVFAPFIADCGPFRSPERESNRPWNTEFLTVLRATHDEKEPSLEARGAGSKIYGGRYQLIVLDDMQSSESLNLTPSRLTYIRNTVYTRLDDERPSHIVDIGSRVGPGDIHETMAAEGMVDYLTRIPVLDRHIPRDEHYEKRKGEITLNPDCEAVPTWPEQFDLHKLAVIRAKVGEEIWARTYMQEAISATEGTFTDDIVQGVLDRERGLGRGNFGDEVICAVDPALDKGYAGFVACATSADKLWVLDAFAINNLYRNEDIIALIADWSAKYRPVRWIVEQNNFQRGLARDQRLEELAGRFRFELVPHQTSRNKNDPVLGIAMMASAFSEKEVSIPWASEAQPLMQHLVSQLRRWSPLNKGQNRPKDDLVLSTWFCWMDWEARRQVAPINLRQWRPSWIRKTA